LGTKVKGLTGSYIRNSGKHKLNSISHATTQSSGAPTGSQQDTGAHRGVTRVLFSKKIPPPRNNTQKGPFPKFPTNLFASKTHNGGETLSLSFLQKISCEHFNFFPRVWEIRDKTGKLTKIRVIRNFADKGKQHTFVHWSLAGGNLPTFLGKPLPFPLAGFVRAQQFPLFPCTSGGPNTSRTRKFSFFQTGNFNSTFPFIWGAITHF